MSYGIKSLVVNRKSLVPYFFLSKQTGLEIVLVLCLIIPIANISFVRFLTLTFENKGTYKVEH